MSIAILKFRIKEASQGGLDVYYNTVKIGEMLVGCDGFYAFWPELRGGFWDSDVLLATCAALNKLNEPWQKRVDEFVKIATDKFAEMVMDEVLKPQPQTDDGGRCSLGELDAEDCTCHGTAKQADCALSGCSFCLAAERQVHSITEIREVISQMTSQQWAGFTTIPLRTICDWRDRLSRAIGDVPFDGIARDASASKNQEQPKRKWYHTLVIPPAPKAKKEMECVYQVKFCTDGRYTKPVWKEVSYSEFKAAQGKPFHATRILLIDTDAQ